MRRARGLQLLVAAASGALTVFAFAPFAASGVAFATLTLLFWQWQTASTARDAALIGFTFGAGLYGAGASWLYIAIQTFGGMPPWLAATAIALLVAYFFLTINMGYATHALGVFKISFGAVGGTEMRILLAVVNLVVCETWMWWRSERTAPRTGWAPAAALAATVFA